MERAIYTNPDKSRIVYPAQPGAGMSYDGILTLSTYAQAKAAISAAPDLDALSRVVRDLDRSSLDPEDVAELVADLPTYGGDHPGYDATFSWDADRVLCYDGSSRNAYGEAVGWVIVPRDLE